MTEDPKSPWYKDRRSLLHEEEHGAMFGKRKMDLLDGRVKKLETELGELKAYVNHLGLMNDPDRLGEEKELVFKKAEGSTSGL